jgi:hypothetical protein
LTSAHARTFLGQMHMSRYVGVEWRQAGVEFRGSNQINPAGRESFWMAEFVSGGDGVRRNGEVLLG